MTSGLHDLSPGVQLLIFFFAALAALGVGWQGLFGPAFAATASSRARLADLENQMKVARVAALRLGPAERELQRLEAALDDVGHRDAGGSDPQAVLQTLHEIAAGSTVDIATFKLRPPASPVQYASVSIDLGIEGHFHDLSGFLRRLAARPELVSVGELHLKSRTRPAVTGTLVASCVVTAYQVGNDPAGGSLESTHEGRDPFESLIAARAPVRTSGSHPPTGLAGLSVAEAVVRGIVRSGDKMLAILEGPANRSFVARLRDRLLDGSVLAIDGRGVVLLESGGRAPRQIRKSLRPAGEDLQ